MRWRLQRRGQSDRRGGDCARRGRRCGHRGRPRRGSRGVRGSPFRLAPHACGSRHRRRRGRDGPVDAMAACPWSVFHLQVRQRPRDGRCSSRRSPPRTRSQIRNSARASAAVAAALACVDVGGCARGRGNERGKKGGGSRRGKKGRAGGGGGGVQYRGRRWGRVCRLELVARAAIHTAMWCTSHKRGEEVPPDMGHRAGGPALRSRNRTAKTDYARVRVLPVGRRERVRAAKAGQQASCHAFYWRTCLWLFPLRVLDAAFVVSPISRTKTSPRIWHTRLLHQLA